MGRPRDACLPPPPPVGRQGGRGTAGVPPAPAARSAAKPRTTQWRRGAPLRTYPTGQSSAQARERRPPVGTAARSAAKPRIAQWRCSAPLRTYSTGQSGAQARERRPPVGTAARRAAAAPPPTVGMAPFSAHTPPGRAARRPGNADLRSARAGLRPAHGAWPRGGAAPLSTHTPPGRAARRQGNADLRSAPLRAAQRNHASPSGGAALLSAHTPPGRAARRPGNADLRPVLPVGEPGQFTRGQGTPTSGRHALASGQRTAHRRVAVWRSSPHIPHRAERRAGKGTPTSGRHRWPPASARRIAPWERRSSDRHSGPQGRGGTAPGAGETPTPLPARSVLLRTMAGEIPSYPDLRNAR